MKKILATIACLILGPFFAWEGLSDLITGTRAKSWPTVQGVIMSTDLTESRGRKGTTSYNPIIKYNYQVGGTNYIGDRVDIGDRGTSSMEDALATVSRDRKGQIVTVHYDAKIPETALLEVGATGDNWIVLSIGLLMTGVGVFLARVLWRDLQSNNYAPSNGF